MRLDHVWYRFGRFLVSLLARAFLELSILRKAPLPSGPVILAANHPSTVDPALLTLLIPDQISILILGSLFKIPLFGKSLRFCGHIPVLHGNGQQALDQAKELLGQGKPVAIFPEGVISPQEGGLSRPRSGLARLALSSGAPVIPVGIHLDARKIRKVKTRVDGKDDVGTWYFHGPYAITVGKPLTFQGDAENRELVGEVSEQIMEQIDHLSIESALRIRTVRKLSWVGTAGWWLWSPIRLIRAWFVFGG
jgi:1-acyl-sn-glycerol-3-phosphate acyltransferase